MKKHKYTRFAKTFPSRLIGFAALRIVASACLLLFPLLAAIPASAARLGPTEYYCDWSGQQNDDPQAAIETTIFQDQGRAECTDFVPIHTGRSGGGQSFMWTFECPGATVPTLTPVTNSENQTTGYTGRCGANPATITEVSNVDPTQIGIGCADGTTAYGHEGDVDTLCASHGGRVGSLEGDCTTFDVDHCGILGYIIIVINVLSAIVGIVVVIMIVLGGIQYISARDNPQAVAGARERIINALLALVFYLGITAFLQWLVPGGIFSG
jgi:hypothetical protein